MSHTKKHKHIIVKKEGSKEKEPEFTVQVNNPIMLRKDLLESLREVIIFMQGYEKFRKIQDEKIATFSTLKKDIKELSVLMEQKFRKYLPKGKLKVAHLGDYEKPQSNEDYENTPLPEKVAPKKETRTGGLDELEGQLKEIEAQLKGIEQ